MGSISLRTVGAWCALITVAGFVIGIALMASNGVQVLIPEPGKSGADWAADVRDAGDWFVAGAAIVVFAGLFALGAFLGLYHVLKAAGSVMILAPVAGAAGMVLVTISHATPIALANELAPGYSAATSATFDAFASFCLLMNYFGDILVWGVTTPLFAFAILKTDAAPRWIGWVGLVSAFFAGWLGLLAPIWGLAEGLSTVGFFAFFLFMASMGIALLMRRPQPAGVGG